MAGRAPRARSDSELGALYEGLATPVRGHPAAIQPGEVQLREAARAASLDSGLEQDGRRHLERILRASPSVHNGPVLVLDRLEGEVLEATRSSYFPALATTDSLRDEWDREGFGPLRARAHELAGADPLRNGTGRAAAIGLAAAAVHRGRVLLGRRAEHLAADPGFWHVAPSGMAEPGVPLADQLARELREELGVEAAGPAVALGVGFDLGRLRPELCFRLELSSDEVVLGDEFAEACWIDPAAAWPEPLTPAAAAVLSLLILEGWPPAADRATLPAGP